MTAPDDDISAALAGLRRTLEERIAEGGKPVAGALASYDCAGLGRLIRPRLEADGRGWRALGAEIGVSSSDLSRLMAGQPVSAAKIFAVCDWAGIDPRRFYKPARKTRGGERSEQGRKTKAVKQKGFTGKALKQEGRT